MADEFAERLAAAEAETAALKANEAILKHDVELLLTDRKSGFDWEKLAARFEIVLFPIGLITGILAFAEYRHAHERERREEAARAYDRADANYTEFLKLCLEHPGLDCYSGYNISARPAGDNQAVELQDVQQRVMFSMLIDTFESAYVNYNNEHYADSAHDAYCAQWPTWMAAIRKYFRKQSFRNAWEEVGNEFDTRFQRCMNATKMEKPLPAADAQPFADGCMIITCSQ